MGCGQLDALDSAAARWSSTHPARLVKNATGAVEGIKTHIECSATKCRDTNEFYARRRTMSTTETIDGCNTANWDAMSNSGAEVKPHRGHRQDNSWDGRYAGWQNGCWLAAPLLMMVLTWRWVMCVRDDLHPGRRIETRREERTDG